MTKLEQLIKELYPNGVEYKRLQDLAEISTGSSNTNEAIEGGKYPFFVRSQELLYKDEYEFDETAIITAGDGVGVGKVLHFYSGKYSLHQRAYRIHITDKGLLPKFFYFYMQSSFYDYITKAGFHSSVSSIRRPMLNNYPVPVPPLEVQSEIVKILDNFTELTAELTARKKQYVYYRDRLLDFGVHGGATGECEWRTIKEIAENCDSKRKPVTKGKRTSGIYPYYGASGIVDYVDDYLFDGDYLLISEDGANLLARSTPIAFSISGKNWVNNHAHVLRFDTYVTRRFVEIYLNSINLEKYISTAAQPKLTQDNLNKIPIPYPEIEEQTRIVNILDRFDKLCNDISEGLPAEIEARRKQYEYYRDKLLSFEERNNA